MKQIIGSVIIVNMMAWLVWADYAGAEVNPETLNLPAGPTGSPKSDCEQTLLDWSFPEEKIVSRTREYLFLLIDRYGGKRENPDYRGAMCRVRDMQEMWSVSELFLNKKNITFTNDGRYMINAIGRVTCNENNVDEVLEMGALVFHNKGEIIREYKVDALFPNWQEVCRKEQKLDWIDHWYSFEEGILEDNRVFQLKTKNGVMHYFDIATGNITDKPQEPEE